MAIEDNQVLPGATGAGGGMQPNLLAFIHMLMSGGLPGLGGLPFSSPLQGGFEHFLTSNPGLMHGLGLLSQQGGGPFAGLFHNAPTAPPVQDSAPAGPVAAPVAPATASQVPSQDPAAASSPTSPGAPAHGTGGLGGLLGSNPGGLLGSSPGGLFSGLLPMLRRG